MSEPTSEQSIFLQALAFSAPAEREAFLDQACRDKPKLRAEVGALLAAHDRLGSPLPPTGADRAGPEAAAAQRAPASPAPETPGTVIGTYKLLEPIGEGGMGTVWMAQQTEPVKRLVALKLIKAGMDSKQVIARFEAERQALALMDHANIARVLDAGTTGAGRPYFVMDLVKGVPITRYCDEHRLTPRQRLELFIPVCQAVQHAHQKGIIHRDLKPSNVLVAQYDGKPVPKVIDFGVAKAAGQSLTDKTLVTGFGAIVGTLEYMSPEQADINQLDIDTRSDIYALGVLLYELLTGSPPFSRGELEKAGVLEILRVIREQEPSKPSTKLSTAEGLPTLAANRGTEPAKLTKLVRGELDWIVMKALEKDRSRRYESASAFAADMQRYLNDEPVLACPPSAWYRFGKFARKHKPALAIASVVVAALVLGLIGLGIDDVRVKAEEQAKEQERGKKEQALNAKVDAERRRANAEQKRAEEEMNKAEALNGWRRTAFFRQLSLAFHEWHIGTPQRAEEMLHELKKEEFKDLRGWEFDYLIRVFHSDLHSVSLDYYYQGRDERNKVARRKAVVRDATLSPDGKYGVVSWYGQTAFDLTTGKEVARFGVGMGPQHIWAPAFSPDGKLLVSGGRVPPSKEACIWLWDRTNGKEVRVLTVKKGGERRGETRTVAFSPDGRFVAAAGIQSNVYVWELATGEQRLHIDAHPRPDLVDRNWRTSLAFGPDGNWLATASGADRNVKLWDTKTGALLKSLGEGTAFDHMTVSPNGKWIAAADDDLSLRVWDVKTGQTRHVFRTKTWPAHSLAFSPDETQLAAGNDDATVMLWDLETGKEVGTYRGHTGSVMALCFSPNGQRLISLGMDGEVKTWDARRGPEVLVLKPRQGAWSAAVSPDGRLVAMSSTDGWLRVCDPESGKVLWRNPWRGREYSYQAAFSPDGAYLAEGIDAWDRGGVALWDMAAAFQLQPRPVARLVAQSYGAETLLQPLAPVAMLQVDPPVQVRPLPAKVGGNWAVPAPGFVLAYSPDGKHVATSGQERLVRVWNVATGQEVYKLGPHNRSVTGLAFSRDCRLLVSASGGWTFGSDIDVQNPRKLPYDRPTDVEDLKVWDMTTGQELLSLSLPRKTKALALRPDGKVVAAGFEDKTVRLYEIATGKEIRVLRGHAALPREAAWSPDGSRLVTAGTIDDGIKLWDPSTGEEILTLARATQDVTGLTFSPDGRKIVLSTQDDVRVWDATPLKKD
jgi:WD40 repeat protein/serine/threonine protein kinase